ncbi:MAG: hypothetical protein ABSB50_19060 [Terracidiphilus sp.]|jgi:hypothetical protein
MESTKAYAGEELALVNSNSSAGPIHDSILRLFGWLEKNEYRGYDTFDGLSSKLLFPLTFGNRYLQIVLQQGVRRFPLNLRPLLGIAKSHSSKGMGFLARGFIRLSEATDNPIWAEKARFCLRWLIENQSPGYPGPSWGNHFEYVSRSGRISKGVPTVVWTSLIGQAFLDGYDHFHDDEYLQVAVSICEHIAHNWSIFPQEEDVCIGYTPDARMAGVHNANTLGAAILGRTYAYTRNEAYRDLAQKALRYTAERQRPNGSWYYGEPSNLHWVDNFHTGYVLDSFKHYADGTGDPQFQQATTRGYEFWKNTFFLPDGTPKYYDFKTFPLDIQCCSQAIDTLIFFSGQDPDALPLALKVAQWTIANMQDRDGHFYYRRYSPWLVNKTPTLHWGQATTLCALGGLYQQLSMQMRSA